MCHPEEKTKSRTESVYNTVKDMAISFKFKPGERINEVDLAQRLGASRTPLREALNRLVAEGFLVTKQGRGFFCRDLKPREMYELYQFRAILESAAVRLACELATEQEVNALLQFLEETSHEREGSSSEELVALDEHFHQSIAALSRNMELIQTLKNVNDRIKYFRWVDMDERRKYTQKEHLRIAEALAARDADLAAQLMNGHIARRLDQITAAVKESFSRIYLVS